MIAPDRDLDAIARVYDPSTPATSFDWYLKRFQRDAMRDWLAGDSLLELGCATGELTSLLAPFARDYAVLEGAVQNIEVTRRRVPSVRFVHGRWEEADVDGAFTDIVCSGVLEHVADADVVLGRCHGWLGPGGRLHVCVPNGLSLHRQVAVELGMLGVPWEVNDQDRAQGHWRNYTIDTLQRDLRCAGWVVRHWEGIGLKPAPGPEMLAWPPELLQALNRVAKRLGSVGAELYVVAEEPASPSGR
jgi:SAM-dependent methyltransferase